MAATGGTQKQIAFRTMPMRDRQTGKWYDVDVVPGIGEVSKNKLAEEGFTNVSQLIGQFLLFNCDNELMDPWIKEKIPTLASDKRTMIVTALKEWTDNNL